MDVKEAVEIAFKYFNDLYPNNNFEDILLEEIELSEDEKYWFVTIGYSVIKQKKDTSPLSVAFGVTEKIERYYKIFKINNANKRVISMKIRSL